MRPKILIFEASDKWGGIESYIQNELLPLSTEFEFYLVAVGSTPQMLDRFSLDEDHIFRYPNSNNAIIHFRWIFQLFKQNNFDIIYFNKNSAVKFWPVAVARLLTKAKIVVHSHNTQPSKPGAIGILHRVFRPIMSNCADSRLACSRVAANYLFGSSQSDVEVVPNGINVPEYSFSEIDRNSMRGQLGISANSLVFINVGRLSKQKNQIFLLPVFRDYLESNPDSYLLLIGDGEQRRVLQDKIDELGIGRNVLLLGSQPAIKQYYSAADCGVFPSLYEGLPIALIEAQASGLPIIASSAITREVALAPDVLFLELNPIVWLESMKSVAQNRYGADVRLMGRSRLARSPFNRQVGSRKIARILRTLL